MPFPSWYTGTRPLIGLANACKKLREEIPRQMFKIAIQGAIRWQNYFPGNCFCLSKGM